MNIQQQIYATYQQDAPRPHLGASIAGKQCARAIWYQWRHAYTKKHDGRLLRLFKTGHLAEDRIIAELRQSGYEVKDRDENGKQFAFSDLGGHFAGSCDGMIKISDEWHLLEVKTHNQKYCSKECRNKETLKKLLSEESKRKAKQTHKQRVLSGEIVYPSGEQHPRWNGGATEARKRRIQSGKSKETLKKYRLKNPDKVREWSSKRKKLKIGRLPRGTIKNKGQQQRPSNYYV
jgi:hypothetical protein